jgi:hypothetical protein
VIINFSKPNWVWTLDQCQAVTQKQETDPPTPTIIRAILSIIHNHGSQRMKDPILINNHGFQKKLLQIKYPARNPLVLS